MPNVTPSNWLSLRVNVRSPCWNLGAALLRLMKTRTIHVAFSSGYNARQACTRTLKKYCEMFENMTQRLLCRLLSDIHRIQYNKPGVSVSTQCCCKSNFIQLNMKTSTQPGETMTILFDIGLKNNIYMHQMDTNTQVIVTTQEFTAELS